MKKNAYTILICLIAIVSITGLTGCKCSDSDKQTPAETLTEETANDSLSITAPSGDKIAEDMESLEEQIKLMIAEKYGEDIPFEITSIEYADVPQGYYFATINYRMENGIMSNFAITNLVENADVKINESPNSVTFEFKSEN